MQPKCEPEKVPYGTTYSVDTCAYVYVYLYVNTYVQPTLYPHVGPSHMIHFYESPKRFYCPKWARLQVAQFARILDFYYSNDMHNYKLKIYTGSTPTYYTNNRPSFQRHECHQILSQLRSRPPGHHGKGTGKVQESSSQVQLYSSAFVNSASRRTHIRLCHMQPSRSFKLGSPTVGILGATGPPTSPSFPRSASGAWTCLPAGDAGIHPNQPP